MILKCLYRSENMAFNKRTSCDRETFQLLQYPITPLGRCMVPEDLLSVDLPLNMAKPPTQQKTAFHLISFLDTTLGCRLSYPVKTGRLNPTLTGNRWASSTQQLKASIASKTGICQRLQRVLDCLHKKKKSCLISVHLLIPLRSV